MPIQANPSAIHLARRRSDQAATVQPPPAASPAQNRGSRTDATGSKAGVTFSGQGTSSFRPVSSQSAGAENTVSGNTSDSPFQAPPRACRSAGIQAHSTQNAAASAPANAASPARARREAGNASGNSAISTTSRSGRTRAFSFASRASASAASPPAAPAHP